MLAGEQRGRQIQAIVDAVLIHAAGSPEACNAGARASLRALSNLTALRGEMRRLGLAAEFDAWLATQPDVLSIRDTSSEPDRRR